VSAHHADTAAGKVTDEMVVAAIEALPRRCGAGQSVRPMVPGKGSVVSAVVEVLSLWCPAVVSEALEAGV
jgi:hypothetical protein